MQAGQDQGVAAHHDAEVHAPGQADIFFRVGHVAGGVLGGHDVVDLSQSGDSGGIDAHVGLGLVVVDDDGQAGRRGDFPVVRVKLFLGLAHEHGGQHAQRVDAADLFDRFGDFRRTPGGDVVRPGVDLHPARDRVLGDVQQVGVEAQIVSVEFTGGAEGEDAVDAALIQVFDQVTVCLFVEFPVFINGSYDRDDDAFGGEAHGNLSFQY